ncbi:outer membrane protein assembly factor BamE [Kushneria sinocarnis]
MSRQQVQQVMGSPLLDDPFDASVWDYVYRLKTAEGEVIRKRVTLNFDNNQLAGIEKSGNIDASERASDKGAPASGAAIQPGEVVSPDQGGGY